MQCSRVGINLSEKNGQWKGNNVGYSSLHTWIKKRKFKTGFCNDCHVNTDRLDLANISQEYKRDISDWEWLCRLCHMKKDGRINILLNHAKTWDCFKSNGWRNREIKKGTDVNTNKLTEKQVLSIRKELKEKSLADISKKYGVKKSCISKIATGRNWKWLKGGK